MIQPGQRPPLRYIARNSRREFSHAIRDGDGLLSSEGRDLGVVEAGGERGQSNCERKAKAPVAKSMSLGERM